jgi:hypothetical protein
MLLLYGSQLYGHALAALLAYSAWLLVEEAARPSLRVRLALGGVLAAGAIAVEYHTAIIAAAMFVLVAARHRGKAAWFVLGALPPAIATGLYHAAAFGAPWHLPYGYYATSIPGAPTDGGYDLPSLRDLGDVLIGNKGLMVSSPLVLVALAAALFCVAKRGPAYRHACLGAAVTIMYVVLVAGWSGSKLMEDPGPRYLVPAIPFLAVPLAVMWDRVRMIAKAAIGVGAIVMLGATLTPHLTNINASPVVHYAQNVADGNFNTNLWSMMLGPVGTVVYVVTVMVAAAALAHEVRRHPSVRH